MSTDHSRVFWFVLGALITIVGITLFLYPEVSYRGTERIEIGPVVIEKARPKVIYVPQSLSILLIGIGLVLMIVSSWKGRR